MELRKLILTKNNCYITGKPLTPKGIMVHSTGANNPNLRRYIGPDDGLLGPNQYGNHWNQPTPDGRSVCVHAFIGKLLDGSIAAYQTLPWSMRAWHAGSGMKGSANDTHIGFEICEDGLTDSVYFGKVYQEAVEFCAYLCKQHDLDPLADGVLIDHREGYKYGIASDHSDAGYWFSRFGKSMDTFRAAVKNLMEDESMTQEQFNKMYEAMIAAEQDGDDPSPWAKEACEVAKGVFQGDGQGNYGWKQPLTREMAAVILQRTGIV